MAATKGEATKEAIRLRAMAEFRRHGYEVTALGDIATYLGISRAAVLHHYGSKLGLLHAVVDPYLDALGQIVARHEESGTATVFDRHELLSEFFDVCLVMREPAGILSWDITSRSEPSVAERVGRVGGRFHALIAGFHATDADRLITSAVLAVIVRPLTDPLIDPKDPQTRSILLGIANAAIDQIGSL